VVAQSVNGKLRITWPNALKTAEPVIPLPADSPYGKK